MRGHKVKSHVVGTYRTLPVPTYSGLTFLLCARSNVCALLLQRMAEQKKRMARWYFGGLASAGAACITHPLDLLKVAGQNGEIRYLFTYLLCW